MRGTRHSHTAKSILAPWRMMPSRSTADADHVAGDVGQEQQRDVVRVADPDEAGRLVGGVGEEDPGHVHRLVGDEPDRTGRRGGRNR